MPKAHLFSYNLFPNGVITGCTQYGDMAVSLDTTDTPGFAVGNMGNPYHGPDEDLGYVIAKASIAIGRTHKGGSELAPDAVGFIRSSAKTDASFVTLVNQNFNQSFSLDSSGAITAKNYLTTNEYWTSWISIVTPGLIMQLDANSVTSYPGTGTTVYDLTGSYNHTASGGFTTLSGVKCFGENSVIRVNGTGPTLPTSGYTYVTWARIKTSSASWRTLFRTAPDDHPILVEIGTDNLGFYDNNTASFKDSGYDVTSIEGVWVQYSVVGDSSSSIFYINGTQVGTSVAFGAGGNRHDYWGLTGQEFGYLANLYLYNRKLTTAEILQNYTALKDRF